jgi:hypothetical protein
MSDPHAAALEDEPKTPMWLPALGAALFVAVALWWAVTPSTPSIAPEPAASASASVAAAAPALPAPAPAPSPQQLRPGQAVPPPSANPHGIALPLDAKAQDRLRAMQNQAAPKASGARR